MSGLSSVTLRLWLVLSFAVVVITAATALQTRDLLVSVSPAAASGRPAACVPGTVSKPVPDAVLTGVDLSAPPKSVEVGCTSWWEVGRRALVAAGICLFALIVMLGFFWVRWAGKEQESR